MPRGNDKEAALNDLADKFGKGVGNAEELIEASLRERSEALRRAELLPVDPDATRNLDLGKLKGPNGENVVSAKVRGGTTVVVYEDSRGAYKLAALDEKNKVYHDKPQVAVADFPTSADRPPFSPEQYEQAYGEQEAPPTPTPASQSQTQSKNDDAQVDAAKGQEQGGSKSRK